MGYNSTLKKYLQAMNSSASDKVNQVSTTDLASLTEEDKNTLSNSQTIKSSERSLEGETHQDDKTFLERSRDTLRSVNLNVIKGTLDFFDSIGDFFLGAVGTVASWFGNEDLEDKTKDAINYDWTTQGSEILWNVGGGFVIDPLTGNADKISKAYNTEEARNDFEETTTGNYNENIENVVNSVEQGIGNALPSLALTGGMAGTGASKTAKVLTQGVVSAVKGAGSGYSKVASEDGDLGIGSGYAAIKGALGFVSGAGSTLLGGALSDTKAGDLINKANDNYLSTFLGSKVATKVFGETGKTALANFLGNATYVISSTAIDTAFNVAEDALDPVLRMIYNSNALDEAYGTEEAKQKTLTNIAKGAITSAITSGLISTAKISSDIDGSQGLKKNYVAENTQKVIDSNQELKQAQNKVLDLQDQIAQTISDSEELNKELNDSETTEERKNEIKREQELNATFVETASVEMAKASDTLMRGITKETIANKNVLQETEKISNLHETNKALLKDSTSEIDDNGYKQVDTYSIKETEDGALEYEVKGLLEAPKTIEALQYTENDRARIQGSVFGLNDNEDYIVKAQELSNEELDIVATCLKDTNSTYKISNKGNKTFIEYSNGTKLLFEDRELKQVNGTTPTWATQLKTDIYNNAPESMKKDSAKNGYVSQKTGVEAINTLNKNLVDTGFFKNIDKQAKILNTAWDFAKTDSEKKTAVSDFVQQLVKKENFKNGVDIKFKNVDDFFLQVGTSRREVENTMYDYLNANEKLSTQDKYNLRYQEMQSMYNALIGNLINSQNVLNRFHKSVLQVKNRIKQVSTPQSAGNPNSKNELKPYAKQVFSSISTFSGSNGKISAKRVFTALYGNKTSAEIDYNTKLQNYQSQLNNLSEKLQSFTDHEDETYINLDGKYKLVEEKIKKLERNWEKNGKGVHNLDINYDEETYGDFYSEDTKEIIDELKSHFDSKTGEYIASVNADGTKVYSNQLTIGDTELLTGVLNQLMQQNSEEYQTRLIQERSQASTIQEEAKAVVKSRKYVNLTKSITGQIYNFKDMFGENSQFYKTCVAGVIKDHQAQAKNKYLFMKTLTEAQKTYDIKDSDLTSKKVEINLTEMSTGATRKVNLNKGMLYELYAQSLSNENRIKMENDGFQIDNVKYKYDDNSRKAIQNQLKENEMDFVQEVFKKGYNGTTHKALSDYSISKFGYDFFNSNGDYINRNMGNLAFTPETRNNTLGSALGVNKLKTRTNNHNPIEIESFAQHYEKYCGVVADYISSDNVRKLNSLININDKETKQNLITTLNQLNRDSNSGGSFIENWVNSANNINTIKDGTSILNKVYSNAMSVPITLNVGTLAKMYLDPIRMAKLDGVGMGKVFKGYIKGLLSHLPVGNESIVVNGKTYKNSKRYFKENSSTYIKANQEDYAIKNNVMASNFSNITKFLGKGLEVANNDMMSSYAYEVCKQKIKAESPDISTADLSQKATDYFDSISSIALSNSDNLDISDLRSGRNGIITRAIFGVFGGDNQKKAEYWHETIMGTRNSNRRLQAYQSQQESIKSRINENNIEIARLKSELEEMSNNDISTYKDGETELVKTRKIENLTKSINNLNNSYNNLSETIATEKTYTTPKRIVSRTANIVTAFVVSAILETAINVGNDKLKGKDFNWKESLEDLGYDATIGGLPIISTIGSAIKYDSTLSTLQTDGLNNIISTLSSIISLKDDNTPEAKRKILNNSIISIGSLLGLPIENFENYVIGAVKNTNFEAGTKLSMIFKGYSSSYLKKQSQNYLSSGNLTKATKTTQANLSFFKTGSASWKLAKELTQLSAIPRDIPTDLNSNQKDKFMSAYSLSNKAVEKYISTSSYKAKEDSAKKSSIVNLYNAYYQVGMYLADSGNEDNALTTKLQKALYVYLTNRKALTEEQKEILKEYGYSF